MEDKRFTLRMNREIFERVQQQAEKNKRSIAKEIEYLLEQYFKEKDREEDKR